MDVPRLIDILKKNRLSVADLAKETGISYDRLRKWLPINGKIIASPKVLDLRRLEEWISDNLEHIPALKEFLPQHALTGNASILNDNEKLQDRSPPEIREKSTALLDVFLQETKNLIAHDHAKKYQDLMIRVLAIQEMVLQIAAGHQYGSYQAAKETLSIMDDAIAREQTGDKFFEKGRKGKGVTS